MDYQFSTDEIPDALGMLPELTFKYYRKFSGKSAHLVLHGGGTEGIETPFISKIIDALAETGVSVFAFNFPFCERRQEESSGPELAEETTALTAAIDFLRAQGFERIVIVAKSLGGIVASYWLSTHEAAELEVIILGYVLGSVKTDALNGSLVAVIQGEHDRFGDAAAVEKELAQRGVEGAVVEVPGADHSYRDADKHPVYQDSAIALLIDIIQTQGIHR